MSGGRRFLITIPNYEDTTAYLTAWSAEVIEMAKEKGFRVVSLPGKLANRKEFGARMAQHDPRFVMLNGHGDQRNVYGQDGEVLLEMGDEHLLAGKVAYALSCYSLMELGASCASKGADAYIGYALPFMFYFDPSRSATPAKDKIAGCFAEAANAVPFSLLKGQTVSDSIRRSKEAFDKQIERWKLDSSPDAEWVVAALMNDRDTLGFEGKGSATL